MNHFVLTVDCRSTRGIVAAISARQARLATWADPSPTNQLSFATAMSGASTAFMPTTW